MNVFMKLEGESNEMKVRVFDLKTLIFLSV